MDAPATFANERFLVERELGNGGMGVVYQALDRERNMRVALKTLHHMDRDNLYYFKQEFRALHDLVHPNLCALMELINDQDAWFLTMELIEGVSFLSYVEKQRDGHRRSLPNDEYPLFDESRLRSSLAGLCKGLDALHSFGRVHRDIKPANVLVTEGERVVLLDFGLVTESGRLRQTEKGIILGTAEYMAPEQGRSETIGPAADWYSVGVMLYEALTGTLPFKGKPLQILVDKNTAGPIRPGIIKPGLPKDLEFLCMDLLKKDPRERPTGFEILDFVKVLRPSLPLTASALVTRNSPGAPFVGRRTELQLLQKAFDETIAEDSFGAVVIEGVSGVGKSSLVEKFAAELLSGDPSIVMLKGRCYEQESAPFKAFDGVLESLIRHIREMPAEEKAQLLPHNARLLVHLFPELIRSELFAQIRFSPIEIEDPHVLRSRSFDALKEVFSRLRDQRPLIVIIDDMQWADADSLSLLKQLVSDSRPPGILLILLSRFAKDAEDSVLDWDAVVSKKHRRIRLETLGGTDSEELARMLISREGISLDVDAASIAVEAAGHPLYIAELVQHIALGGEEWKSVRLDEVLYSRVNTLPKATRHLLETICVAGTPIGRAQLQQLTGLDSEDFFVYIKTLRASRLIRSRGPRRNHAIEPYHDRVREAVVARALAAGNSTKIHLDIGRFFLRTYTKTEIEQNIFNLVQHLHAGSGLIDDETERLRLAELYFLAGKKARGSSAYASSLSFFRASIEIFSKRGWETHYDTMFSLHCAAAESAYVTGAFRLTNELVHEAKSQAKSNLDKAKIYETYVVSLNADGRPLEAIDEAVGMIEKLGVKLVRRPSTFYVLLGTLWTKLRLVGKTKDHLVNLPKTTDPRILAVVRLLSTIGGIAYLNLPNLWIVMTYKLLQLSLKYGVDHLSTVAYGAWALVNCAFLRQYEDGYKFGNISLSMSEQFNDKSKSAMSLLIWANFVQHWKEHIRDTLPYFLESHKMADKTGDIFYLVYSGTNYCYHAFYASMHLPELAEKCVYYCDVIEQDKHDMAYNTNRIFYQMTLNFLGRSADPVELRGEGYNESEQIKQHIEKRQRLNLFDYYQCKLVLIVYFGQWRDAYHVVLELAKYGDAARGTYADAVIPFYDSLACLKCHGEADSGARRKLLRRVRSNQRKYKRTAGSSPANHFHKFCLVEAERARVKRQTKKAPALYDEAIEGAIKNEFRQDAALACEFAAEYYREIEEPEKSKSYAREALSHYEIWGAPAKVADVKRKFSLKVGGSRV